jgi:hypothetical protein
MLKPKLDARASASSTFSESSGSNCPTLPGRRAVIFRSESSTWKPAGCSFILSQNSCCCRLARMPIRLPHGDASVRGVVISVGQVRSPEVASQVFSANGRRRAICSSVEGRRELSRRVVFQCSSRRYYASGCRPGKAGDQIHGVDGTEPVVIARSMSRAKFVAWCSQLPASCVVAWRRVPARMTGPGGSWRWDWS